MNVICMLLSAIFAIAALAQPGTVRVDIEYTDTATSWSSR